MRNMLVAALPLTDRFSKIIVGRAPAAGLYVKETVSSRYNFNGYGLGWALTYDGPHGAVAHIEWSMEGKGNLVMLRNTEVKHLVDRYVRAKFPRNRKIFYKECVDLHIDEAVWRESRCFIRSQSLRSRLISLHR
jgi:hypothetical protein